MLPTRKCSVRCTERAWEWELSVHCWNRCMTSSQPGIHVSKPARRNRRRRVPRACRERATLSLPMPFGHSAHGATRSYSHTMLAAPPLALLDAQCCRPVLSTCIQSLVVPVEATKRIAVPARPPPSASFPYPFHQKTQVETPQRQPCVPVSRPFTSGEGAEEQPRPI